MYIYICMYIYMYIYIYVYIYANVIPYPGMEPATGALDIIRTTFVPRSRAGFGWASA
jgi:hypothetical protein